MAACINNSTNHSIYLSPDSSNCRLENSFCKFIRLWRLSVNINSTHCKIAPEQDTTTQDLIWLKISEEAELNVQQEPILEKYYNSAILSHSSLESAMANQLSVKLSNENLSRKDLYSIFVNELFLIRSTIRDDLKAVRERDPACVSYAHCLLNFKGFLVCQAHRVAHSLWGQGRTVLALVIQSRVSEVFAMDIHPGAKIGRGMVFDHGTGVVIGETAVIGNDVTILHSVTLGGTGKVKGDRHPKVGDGVLIGAGAKVLGNIRIGENAKIGAGSVVLKDIPAGGTAVGSPARLIGL